MTSITTKKIKKAKKDSKKRGMGMNLLNDFFEGCSLHHINKNDVIAIPKKLHKKYVHDHKILSSMIKINNEAFAFLTKSLKNL